MRRRNKCLLYVLLAVLPVLMTAAAKWADDSAWPNEFQMALLAVTLAYQATVAIKTYYSDPNEQQKVKT